MAARLPVFNLLASLWTCDGTATPADGPADYTDIPCQKYIASKSAWPVSPPWANGFWLQFAPPIQLRMPRVAPFLGAVPTWTVTCVEVPQGSGQYYRLFWNEVQHEGFPNEYVCFVGVQCSDTLKSLSPAGSTEDVGVGEDPCGNTPAQAEIVAIPGGLNCCGGTPVPPVVEFTDHFLPPGDTPEALSSHTADTGETYTVPGLDMTCYASLGLELDGMPSGRAIGIANFPGPFSRQWWVHVKTIDVTLSPLGMGMIFRAQDDMNYFYAGVIDDGAGNALIRIGKVIAGVDTPLVSSPTFAWASDTDYRLLLDVVGDDMGLGISLFDGTPVEGTGDITDSDLNDQVQVGPFIEGGHDLYTQLIFLLTNVNPAP